MLKDDENDVRRLADAMPDDGSCRCGAVPRDPVTRLCSTCADEREERLASASAKTEYEHPAFPWRAVPVTGHPGLVNIVSDEPRPPCDFTPVASMVPEGSWFHLWLLGAEERELVSASASAEAVLHGMADVTDGSLRAALDVVDALPGRRPPLTHVAIRFEGKVWSLPRPYRHHHIIGMIRHLDPTVESVNCRDEDQGFLDASGRYLTRKQAQISAGVNDQIKNGKIIGGVLTSEDLW